MAQTHEARTGDKRGPGRPPKAAQPALKKLRTSSNAQSPLSSSVQSPSAQSPASEKRLNKLPFKISELTPLPTLAEAQAPALSTDNYQSIAASAVLQSSLDRSRLAWVHDGVFERYWTKPDGGKNARAPPPNNPELKWQKHRGPCRIRIEPHIFEAELYVEEKPRPPAPVKQYAPTNYGQPYRAPQYGAQAQGNQYYQNRNLPPIQQPGAHTPNTLPPISNVSQLSPAPTPPASRAQPQSQPQGQEKKSAPDPVISMLANRASSDPELKSLMKEVATGNATQDQLKVFQGHIDDLTKIINEKKKNEEESTSSTTKTGQGEMIRYDGPADSASHPAAAPATPAQQQPRPPYQPQQPLYQHQQPAWTPPPPPAPPPAPTNLPVILQFTTPGATEDRFLFPQHCILESLSPQHLLASFIATRRASALPSTTVSDLALDPQKEYWQPITLMVEVAYNREHLLELVKRWVKPADEVRKHMEEVMGRCERAPDRYLALRLPHKGSVLAADADELAVVEAAALQEREREKEKEKERKNVKYVKKGSGSGVATPVGKKGTVLEGVKGVVPGTPATNGTTAQTPGANEGVKEETASASAGTGAGEGEKKAEGEQATTESGRPRRTTRKSVRISEAS